MLLKIETADRVKQFIRIVEGFSVDLDLIAGHYTIDAKSIMGIFSLDLSKTLELRVYSDDAEVIASVREALADFIIE